MAPTYRLPIQVLVYCFRRTNDCIEYLLLRRTPKYGGFWQGVTGAPEIGESLLEGAARELKEETQLPPKSLDQVDFGYSFPMQDEWKWAYHPDVKSINEYVFLAEIATQSDPVLSFEHDAFEWASFGRAIGLLKWQNNKEALQFCHRLLRVDRDRFQIWPGGESPFDHLPTPNDNHISRRRVQPLGIFQAKASGIRSAGLARYNNVSR